MALIKCPECQKEISMYATACPNCGLPKEFFGKVNTSTTIEEKPKNEPKKKRTRHKLPNGYGYIKKLSGNRTKPYAAYPPSKEMNHKGTPLYKNPLGYFKTYNEAYKELVVWHENGEKEKRKEYTFAEVYEMWFAKYKETHTNKSTLNSYSGALNNVSHIKDRKIRELVTDDLQYCLDNNPNGYSSNKNVKKLIKAVFEYADSNDMINKDYSAYIKNNKDDDTENGIPFTEDDLKLLWKNKDNMHCKIMLILSYTGLRIGELRITNIDLKNRVMEGGLKTTRGRNRIVPIIDDIIPLYDCIEEFRNTSDKVFRLGLEEKLKELNLYEIEETNHTPHDCRHTFSWIADKYEMDEISKHLIMGHSLGKDVEKNVYGHRTLEELKNEMNKIKIVK